MQKLKDHLREKEAAVEVRRGLKVLLTNYQGSDGHVQFVVSRSNVVG